MEKTELKQKYEEELAAIEGKIESAMGNLHDALLRVGTHSIKDTIAAVVKLEDEARQVQICLDALNR